MTEIKGVGPGTVASNEQNTASTSITTGASREELVQSVAAEQMRALTTKAALAEVNQVVAVGSIDGVLSAAAVLRNAAADAKVTFAQAFTVDRVDPTKWESRRNVLFVDLGVDNKEPAKTADFVRRVTAADHKLVGVLDEHNATDWQAALESAGQPVESLAIQPVTGKGTELNSSGALLRSLLRGQADEHTLALCAAADGGDRMDFSSPLAKIANEAVKSKMGDDSRRVYLANHLSRNAEADETIAGWMKEYEVILANHVKILEGKVDLGDGLIRIDTGTKATDFTTLMNQVYILGAKVVIVDGESFNPITKQKERMISFGLNPAFKNLDVLAAIKSAGITASGIPSKANIQPGDEAAAIEAVRALVKGA